MSRVGGGKSRFLDELARAIYQRDRRVLQLAGESALVEQLEATAVVTLTWNYLTPFSLALEEKNPELSLAIRLLYRCARSPPSLACSRCRCSFYIKPEHPFSDFFEDVSPHLKGVPKLVSLVMKAIAADVKLGRKRHLLLLVDEIIKCVPSNAGSKEGPLGYMLSLLTREMDRAPDFVYLLVTSLDMLLLNAAVTPTSNRPIFWVPLPLLTREEALSLFDAGELGPKASLLVIDCRHDHLVVVCSTRTAHTCAVATRARSSSCMPASGDSFLLTSHLRSWKRRVGVICIWQPSIS